MRRMLVVVLSSFFILIFILIPGTSVGANAAETVAAPAGRVSYFRQVLPIFQAHCHGCHQPAKASGNYAMTTYERLVAGGESDSAAIVPGQSDESYLLDMITPADGQAEMPAGKPPLSTEAIALIRQWINQGAENDSPAAVHAYDMHIRPSMLRCLS